MSATSSDMTFCDAESKSAAGSATATATATEAEAEAEGVGEPSDATPSQISGKMVASHGGENTTNKKKKKKKKDHMRRMQRVMKVKPHYTWSKLRGLAYLAPCGHGKAALRAIAVQTEIEHANFMERVGQLVLTYKRKRVTKADIMHCCQDVVIYDGMY
jgi:hypothetical protein